MNSWTYPSKVLFKLMLSSLGFRGHILEVNAIKWLLKALTDVRLFRRNRFSLQLKVRAILLYMAGLSYRDITYVLRLVPCSFEALGQEAGASNSQR